MERSWSESTMNSNCMHIWKRQNIEIETGNRSMIGRSLEERPWCLGDHRVFSGLGFSSDVSLVETSLCRNTARSCALRFPSPSMKFKQNFLFVLFHFVFGFLGFFFETGFLCIALPVLVLTLWLAWNSEIHLSASQSAGITGMRHHRPAQAELLKLSFMLWLPLYEE